MTTKAGAVIALLLTLGTQIPASSSGPATSTRRPLLAAAAREIGEANLRCITFGGTVTAAPSARHSKTPSTSTAAYRLAGQYSRSINWESRYQPGDVRSQAGLNRAAWKYGLGCRAERRRRKRPANAHRNGRSAWHIDGDGEPVPVPPELAELYRWTCG